jgi:hypothetical protein
MLVEVIDKFRVSQMRVGKISEVIGGRLRINYENVRSVFLEILFQILE